MKKNNIKTIKKDNTEYTVNVCFGSEKLSDLIVAYLTERVKSESFKKNI